MTTYNQEQAKKIYQGAKEKGLDAKKVMYLMAKNGSVFEGADMNAILDYGKKTYEPKPTEYSNTGAEIKQNLQEIAGGVKERVGNIKESINAYRTGEQTLPETVGQAVGQTAGGISGVVGGVVKGVAEAALPQTAENVIQKGIGEGAKVVSDLTGKYEELKQSNPTLASAINFSLGYAPDAILSAKDLMAGYEEIKQNNPRLARNLDAALGIAELGIDVATAGGTKVAGTALKEGVEQTGKQIAKNVAEQTGKVATKAKGLVTDTGIGQIATDIAERVPRAAERVKETLATASERANKMKTASPAVKSAMKSNLDDRIINTIESADPATKQAYKDVVDIAGEQSTKIGTKKQPTIVGGELASKQFELINKQKQDVGKKLGDAVKSLDRTTNVNVTDAFTKLDNTLSEQGIIPTYDTKGVKLDFTGSRYTPAERTKIQELYDLATEGGDTLTPSKIREKDQLFSKLKRQSQYEGVGDIIVDTADGQKSLFNVFRDVYSSKLDEISPEIKKLNSEYAKYKNLTDDIEDSIFKTPNFNVTKSTDPAEFAKVNLRRIFGESQSSPIYEAIADVMDTTSRGLGYKGASPKAVAEFAQEMRKLFPDTIPSTGFQGGIKLGVGDIVEKITSVGATNLTDQQKAVKALLESYVKPSKIK